MQLKKQESTNKDKISIMNDAMWYYFSLTHENIEQINKKGEEKKIRAINVARKECLKCLMRLAWDINLIRIDILKDYYDSNTPVFWLATASDINLPKRRQSGNLLLYHLVIEKRLHESNLIKVMYSSVIDYDNTIDNHAWLRISDIKYFGNTDRNGEDSYTLGTTTL